MAERIALISVLLALAIWGAVRPRRLATAPPLIHAQQAQPWMADALPGVGPKRRDAALEALRAGRFADLPKPARATAELVFSPLSVP